MMDCRVSAVILSAGLSTRMGGRFKPLLPLGDTTILGRCIDLFSRSGIEKVFVVTGHRSEDVAPAAKELDAAPVFNPDYGKGMFSSVVTGLKAASADAEAVFLLPVDIPLVQTETIERLQAVYRQHRGKLVRPVYRGRQGHPPLIPTSMVSSIAGWSGPDGLRGALALFETETVRIAVEDPHILFDVDTPEDYERLQKMRAAMGQRMGKLSLSPV